MNLNLKIKISSIALTACLTLFLIPQPLCARQDFRSAQVKDISDRAYEPAVIALLDGAKESIVISMYNISLGTKQRNPIRLLLEDLLEARQRGVEVTLYLNTRFRNIDKDPMQLIENPAFEKLQNTGCTIHLMPPNFRLHDKLIVVDDRYVVEASTNWSISALRDNFESATLIDSPSLAEIKLSRLKAFPLTPGKPQPKPKQPHRALYIENLPANITVSKPLLTDKIYLPRMLTRQDSRSMDLYLLLLAHSQTIGREGFFIDMEAMATSLGMPASWSDSALRRQVIRSLKKLKDNYHLINVRFFHSKDAWVELVHIPADTFIVSSEIIKPNSEKKISMRLKFLLLVKTLLESQGEDIHSISSQDIANRFHIHRTTISEAFKELLEWGKNN
ncbi:MAG: hypothetical protein KKA80_00855 [Candidatus Omnitrophica bacterium]|nr:hypothetical protein [Candidatus Omnitrophota bacterium]